MLLLLGGDLRYCLPGVLTNIFHPETPALPSQSLQWVSERFLGKIKLKVISFSLECFQLKAVCRSRPISSSDRQQHPGSLSVCLPSSWIKKDLFQVRWDSFQLSYAKSRRLTMFGFCGFFKHRATSTEEGRNETLTIQLVLKKYLLKWKLLVFLP